MLFEKLCCTDFKTGICIYAVTILVTCVIFPYSSWYWYEQRIIAKLLLSDMFEALFYIGQFFEFVHIAAAVALAFGAKKEDRKLLLPYLILQGIRLTFFTVVCIYFSFLAPLVLLFLLIIAPLWYIWLCILSFFQSLKPSKHNCAPQTSDDAVSVDVPSDE